MAYHPLQLSHSLEGLKAIDIMKVAENDIFQEIQINKLEKLRTFYSGLDSSWIFRGQANSKWVIKTRIERTKTKDKNFLESQLFQKLDSNVHNFGLTKIPSNEKEKLILLQHYGAPTRLIDFTRSPYVATFFALIPEFEFSAIYAVNGVKIWRLLENFESDKYLKHISEKYRDHPSLLYCNFDDRETFKDLILDNDDKESFIAPIHPEYHHDRTIPQASEFLVIANINEGFLANLASLVQNSDTNSKKQFYKIIIPKDIRLEALADLNRMNINQAALFPGFEGFVKGLYNTFEIEEYETNRMIESYHD